VDIFNRGKPVSVLLDVKLYEDMVERLEDALDAVEMKAFEKKDRSKKDWISHDTLVIYHTPNPFLSVREDSDLL